MTIIYIACMSPQRWWVLPVSGWVVQGRWEERERKKWERKERVSRPAGSKTHCCRRPIMMILDLDQMPTIRKLCYAVYVHEVRLSRFFKSVTLCRCISFHWSLFHYCTLDCSNASHQPILICKCTTLLLSFDLLLNTCNFSSLIETNTWLNVMSCMCEVGPSHLKPV